MADVYVRNAVVKPNFWKVENFFETKKDGYVAASQEYDTAKGKMLVVFKDRQAGFLLDPDTGAPISNKEFLDELASLQKEGSLGDPLEDIYPDSYVQIGVKDTITDETWLDQFGFSEDQKSDIEARMADLENYYVDTVEDMVQ